VHEWRCARCGAVAWEPCLGLRSGAHRRIAHLTRWSTAVVFTLATRWLPRLSAQDRLVLATRAVGTAERRPDGESTPPARVVPAAWTDVTELLWQADLLQRALIDRAIEDADAFVDLEELRQPGGDLAAAMKDAGNLLRQLHTQDDREPSAIAPMVLPEHDGRPRTYLSLTELRAARDLGQVEDITADMTRRAPAVAAATAVDAGRWDVRWEPSGRFHAEPVPDNDHDTVYGMDRPTVLGWAAHPAAVADELGRWSTRPRPAEISWQDLRPGPISRLCSLTPVTEPVISEDHAVGAFWAQPDRLADVLAVIDALRRSIPPVLIPDEVAARAAALQAEEPQLPDLVGAIGTGDPWVLSTTTEWVRTQAVVRTADEVWGEFDRDEDERHARWIPDRTRDLLAVPYAEVPTFLARHFAGHQSEAVRLLRVPGPAGPLYALGSGGSHRTHLCRILGLPWMFAVTTMVPIPRRVETAAVTPPEHRPQACRATADLWRGLLDHKIIRGELVSHRSDWPVALRLEYAPAPWLLLPAEQATRYNQRYELLYPGALAAAGIPTAALDSASAWRAWLVQR
jgi:hypothetical protein